MFTSRVSGIAIAADELGPLGRVVGQRPQCLGVADQLRQLVTDVTGAL